MGDISHPSLEQVKRLHLAVLKQHGGSDGIRDLSLLESALAAPQATFGGNPIMSDVPEIAAAYLFYLCKNHPFIDGNKRVAMATCIVFLRLNGETPAPDSQQWTDLVLDVAASKLDRDGTTDRLRELLA